MTTGPDGAPRPQHLRPTPAAGASRGPCATPCAMAGRNLRRLLRQPEQVMFNPRVTDHVRAPLPLRLRRCDRRPGGPELTSTTSSPASPSRPCCSAPGVTGFRAGRRPQERVHLPSALPADGPQRGVRGEWWRPTRSTTLLGLIVLILTGFAVGFRPASFSGLVLAGLLLLLFALAVSLGYALIGMTVRSAEAVNAATFPIIFPLTFASSACRCR